MLISFFILGPAQVLKIFLSQDLDTKDVSLFCRYSNLFDVRPLIVLKVVNVRKKEEAKERKYKDHSSELQVSRMERVATNDLRFKKCCEEICI